jgi:hypothetical protein
VVRAEAWVQLSIPSAQRNLITRVLAAGDVVSVPLEPGMMLTIGAPRSVSVFLDDVELPLARFTQRGIIRSAPVSRLAAGD